MKNFWLIIGIIIIVGLIFYEFKTTGKVSLPPKDTNSVEDTTSLNESNIINQNNTTITEENIINKEQQKIMQATLNTNKGNITIEFFPEQAPKTVENFIKLAKSGFYDGTKFHRVIKDFMNQGGDPLSKDDSQKALWGTGGPGYKFADEISANNKNDVGTISMANAGPNTNGSQFFINVAPNNFLDTKHTVFGKVISGMDVVIAINNVQTDPTDKPLEAVVINSITLK